jgi:predicted neuraminidase
MKIIHGEFIYERASFPSCHASTLVETPAGLLAAWFGGSEEGAPDVGIWLAHRRLTGWTNPVQIAHGRQPDGTQLPCWNPVLWRAPDGTTLLFYKVGPSPRTWWGMLMASADEGVTWSPPARLPNGILGPIKNKPVLIGDVLLCGSSEEHASWTTHVEWVRNLTGPGDLLNLSWQRTAPLHRAEQFSAIQPAILHWPHGTQLLCRTKQGVVSEIWSHDDGQNWDEMRATNLPNPNSGFDTVMLRDGRALLIYNPLTAGRHQLHAALSADGNTWRDALELESSSGEYSYPAVIQAGDGLIHTTYTWQRERIRHVVIDPSGA